MQPFKETTTRLICASYASERVPIPFPARYPARMRRPWEPIRPVRTREDLVELIAESVRLNLRYLSSKEAQAVADTVLRSFKAAGLRIRQRH